MAFLNSQWISFRALTSLSSAFWLFALAVSGCGSALQAAPLTLRFEATVADGSDVPFSVGPGDVIDVEISFEPSGPGPVYAQDGELRIELSGHTLRAQGFEIHVANDQVRWIDVPGRIADPDNAPDVDFSEIGDNLVISCKTDGPLFCGSIEGNSDFLFRPLIVFSDQPSLLDSNDLPADENIWNAFALREMSLVLQDVSTGRAGFYAGAYVGRVYLVPEPSIFGMICIMFLYGMLAWSRPYRAPLYTSFAGEGNCLVRSPVRL